MIQNLLKFLLECLVIGFLSGCTILGIMTGNEDAIRAGIEVDKGIFNGASRATGKLIDKLGNEENKSDKSDNDQVPKNTNGSF